jgi:leader peptidase (prepilin peptidase)/N-methyltransferase
LVELTASAVFTLLAWHFGASWQLPAFLYLGAVGIALAAIDLDVHRLPNALTLPSYLVGAVLLTIAAVADGKPSRIVGALLGMAVLYVFYFILVAAYPRGMGFGDVKLAGVLGLFLGYLGWAVLAVGAFLSFLMGGVVGVAMITTPTATRKSMVPFGPFMIAGALLAVFLGHAIASLYAGVMLH